MNNRFDKMIHAVADMVSSFTWLLFAILFFGIGCDNDQKDAAIEELTSRVQKLEAAAPGVGATMSAVQMHFSKLYFAAQAANWPLAEFELHEVEENLEKAAALRPEENGTNLVNLTDAVEQTQLAAVRQAIQEENSRGFLGSYKESMAACNGCHEETGRPFLVIILPSSPPVTNQQWKASGPPSK